jgi:helix-turn-helix protein
VADPTRRAILARLAAGAASVTELAEAFAMSLPAVSKHQESFDRLDDYLRVLQTRGRKHGRRN